MGSILDTCIYNTNLRYICIFWHLWTVSCILYSDTFITFFWGVSYIFLFLLNTEYKVRYIFLRNNYNLFKPVFNKSYVISTAVYNDKTIYSIS